MSDTSPHAGSSPPQWFVTTHWSVVMAAGRGDSTRARAALEKLCKNYWYPLYAFVRRLGHGAHDAEDLVQSFFAVCLEKNYLGAADQTKGRFRSFLLLALKRFLANEWDKARTLKRGGTQTTISLDSLTAEQRYALEPAEQLTADKLFERRWALTLLDQVLARLRDEQAAAGKLAQFEEIKESITAAGRGTPYVELATRLGTSEGAIKVMVHRLRQRYRELLEAEIANTVSSPEEIDQERRHLLAALS
ncbi:MAG TPA: RNA polymerase sigma factor [Verrucomicrobiae bacterium]|jgi:RNA polymerase sigma-70 factor (ECF subfamily)